METDAVRGEPHAEREPDRRGARHESIVHVAAAREPGGLLGVIRTLASRAILERPAAVIAGIRPPGAAGPWAVQRLDGNRYLSQHLRLLRRIAESRPALVFMHAGSPGEMALAAALCAVRWPTVVVEHAPQFFPRTRSSGDRLYAWLKRRSDAWVAVSSTGARALEHAWGLTNGTIGTVHPGVERPAAEGVAEETLVLGLGRPDPAKGFDVFCAVAETLARSFPAVRWRWVGSATAGVRGPVELRPWTSEIGRELRGAALVLLPSRAEGLPLTLLEAFALGRAVIASRVGGIPEAAEDGVEALLLTAGDLVAWTAVVARLLRDAPLRSDLGLAANARWQSHFTAEAMVGRFERVAAAAIARRSGRR